MEQLAVSELQQITVEQAFNRIKFDCNPKFGVGTIFDMFFGGGIYERSKFVGGCGDPRRTTHENIFALLHPKLKTQVSFGTRKGGYEKYGAKRYIVDFFDDYRLTAYEIDGSNHKSKIRNLKDRIRTAALYLEHGIETVRYTNHEVEMMLFKRLKELENEERLHLLFELSEKEKRIRAQAEENVRREIEAAGFPYLRIQETVTC